MVATNRSSSNLSSHMRKCLLIDQNRPDGLYSKAIPGLLAYYLIYTPIEIIDRDKCSSTLAKEFYEYLIERFSDTTDIDNGLLDIGIELIEHRLKYINDSGFMEANLNAVKVNIQTLNTANGRVMQYFADKETQEMREKNSIKEGCQNNSLFVCADCGDPPKLKYDSDLGFSIECDSCSRTAYYQGAEINQLIKEWNDMNEPDSEEVND